MLRILFLILCLFSIPVFAQTQAKPKAYKFFEYGKISNKLLEEKLQDFKNEVDKLDKATGVTIIYGKPFEIAKAVKQIAKNMFRCGYDGCSRFSLVKVTDNKKHKSEFWIVPKDAEPPPTN